MKVLSKTDLTNIDDYISKIQQIRDMQNVTNSSDETFNAVKIEGYSNALKNLTSEQQALILSTQGLSTAQIQQVLAAKKAEDGSAALTAQAQYQAMAEAGLLTSKRTLTEAEMAETVQIVFGTDAEVAQTMAKIGATTATDAEGKAIVKVTANKVAEAIATGKITKEEGMLLAARTGLNADLYLQIRTLLPNFIKKLQTTASAISAVVKETLVWMTTTPAGMLTAAVGIVGVATFAYGKYKEAIEEARKETQLAADQHKETANDLDSAIEKYHEYNQALKDAGDDEEKIYAAKKNLLDLQNDLNEKYGDAYGKINLVTEAYDDQATAIRNLSKAAANEFLNDKDNRGSIDRAEKKMTEKKTYTLTPYDLSIGSEYNAELRKIAEKYKDQGMQISDNSFDDTFHIKLVDVDPTQAYQTIQQFETDVRAKAKELGDEHLFDNVLNISGDASDKAKDIIDKWKSIREEGQMANIAGDDTLTKQMDEASDAVEKYNNALLKSKNPYEDEDVKAAYDDIQKIKATLQDEDGNWIGDWQKYGNIIADVFDKADTKVYDFAQQLKSDNGLKEYTDQLKGMSDVDVKALLDSDDKSIAGLKQSANEAGIGIEQLISVLKLLGVVEETASTQAEEVTKPFTKSEMISEINGLSEGFEELDKIMSSIIDKDKAFDFSLLDDKKFRDNFKGYEKEFNAFYDTITKHPKDIKACQQAFDDLTTAFVYNSKVMKGLSDDNADVAAQYLKLMGVTNAEEVVTKALAERHAEAAWSSRNLSDATYDEINALATETESTEDGQKAFKLYIAQKILASDAFDPTGDISALSQIIESLGIASDAWIKYNQLRNQILQMDATAHVAESGRTYYTYTEKDKNGNTVTHMATQEEYENKNKILDNSLDDLRKDIDEKNKALLSSNYSGPKKTVDTRNSDAKSGKGKSEKEDKKFDWIKVKIDKVRESYEKLMDEVNDSDNAYSTQLNFLDAAIDRQKELIETEKLGIAGYQKEWEETSSKISDDIKNQIMNGDDVVSTYDGDKDEKLIKKIEAAQTAWNNLSDAQKQYITDQKTLEDNEKSRYTKSIEWKQSEIDDLKEKADIEQTSYEKNIDLMNQAVKKSEELVAAEKQHAEETKKAWEEVRDQLKPEDVAALMDGKADFEQYAEIDPAYYELFKNGDLLYSEYLDSVKKLQEGELNLQETRKQAYEKGIEYIEKQIDYISGLNDKASAEKDLIESMGGIVTEGMYRDMISNSKDMMDLYESEIDSIKDRMSDPDLKPDSSEYYELLGNLQSCETALINCQKNQAEWNEAIIRLPIERIQKYLNELANIKQDLNNFLSQKSSIGIATNKDQYQQLISIDQAQIDKYTEQQKKLQNLLKNYKYGSEKFNETSSEIQEIDNAISDLIVEMQDYNYQIARIPVDNLQKVVDTLDNAQTSIENLTAQQDARGIQTTIDQYQTMIDLASKRIEVLSTQRQMLVQLQSQFEKGSDRYTEIGSEIQDIDNTISGLIVNQYEWNKAMLQIPIDRLSNVNDELSAYSSILSDVLSEYDSALSGVTGTIDEQTKAIEDARSAAEDDYNKRIENIQKELDLLEKTNEARSVQIALENAQYELDKARQQKKTQVVRNGQLTYENDPDEIRDKQQALQDAEYNKAKYDLQKQIDSLEEERDALLESYDNQLDSLNKIKDKWSEITDQIQLAADKAKAENLFGAGWEDKVLSGNDDDLYNMFKNLYTVTSEQKNKVDEQISSNERIADMMQIYADRFQSGAMTYDQAMAGINGLATSMKDGYSALENLGDLMKADNIADLGSIASSATNKISESLTDLSSIMERVKNNYSTMDPATWEEVKHDVKEQAKASESLSASMNEFNQYLGTFKENTEAINKYTKTWDDMRDDLQSQLESLKKAAEALEKMSSSSSSRSHSSSSGGSSSSSGSSSDRTGVYYGGHKVYESDSKGNYYTESKDSSGKGTGRYDNKVSASEKDKEWKNYTKKHDGIASGLVGNNKTMSDNERESRFKKLGMRELDTNEIWVKALRDEVVLTKGQQETLLKNFDASMNVGIRTGAAIGMPTVQPSKQVMNDVVNVEIGDIHVHDVGDVNGFAKAVKTQIKPIMTQTFSRR